MEQKLVSIVMPNYNSEKYLRNCIESVLQQTYKNFEFIIIDDNSTDTSREIINSYTDERITLQCLSKNNQICNALNKGLSLAKGEYIARIDSDDIWHYDKLEKQIQFLESSPGYKACFSHVNIIDTDGKNINHKEHALYSLFSAENSTQKEWLEYFLTKGNRLSHPSVVFKKEILDEIGIYNYFCLQSQDFELWLRLIIKHPIYVYPKKLVDYRWDENPEKISKNSMESNIRFLNEALIIKFDFFNKLKKEDFIHFFKQDFINPNATSNTEILLEKAILLIFKYGSYKDLKLIGFYLLNQGLLEPQGKHILEEKMGYSLKDIYKSNTEHLYFDILLGDIYKQLAVTKSKLEEAQLVYKELEETKKTVATLNMQIDYLNKHVADVTFQLHGVVNSSSWKVTKPMRKIISVIGSKKSQ